MSAPDYVDAAIDRTYKLESLLRVLSMAVDGEQICGKTFEHVGGGSVIDMAADMAGDLLNELEYGKKAQESPAAPSEQPATTSA